MSSDDLFLQQEEVQNREQLKAQAVEGGKAKDFLASDSYQWLDNFILKALEDEAMETLRKSKTEEDRVKAQQMLLAANKPREILNRLVTQGDAAKLQLLSTHQNGG